jgi:MFS family permease
VSENEHDTPESALSLPKDLPSAALGAVAVIGVLVYGLLAAAYDKFYSELGLTPADVGVQYGKTLGGAAALAVLASILVGALTLLILWLNRVQRASQRVRRVRRLFAPLVLVIVVAASLVAYLTRGLLAALTVAAAVALISYSILFEEREQWRLGMAIGAAITVSWFILAAFMAHEADITADKVKDGFWVEPPGSGGLVILSVRAMPIELSSAGTTPEDQRFVQDVREHRLLFLGQSNGQLVVYDATAQEALILPAADFRAPIINCETVRQQDSRCNSATGK